MKQVYIFALVLAFIAAGYAVVVNSAARTETAETPQIKAADAADSEATITLEEISTHDSEDDCWMAIDGVVYDVSAFFNRHPGGGAELLRGCGIDASQAFATQGGEGSHSSFARNQLAEFEIGTLAE